MKHGGKRKGSGRKKTGSTTTVIRVPLIHKEDVKKFVLDLEKRPVRNEEGKIKTIHKIP